MNADVVQQNMSPDNNADILNVDTFGDSADDVVICEESMDGIKSSDENDSNNIGIGLTVLILVIFAMKMEVI